MRWMRSRRTRHILAEDSFSSLHKPVLAGPRLETMPRSRPVSESSCLGSCPSPVDGVSCDHRIGFGLQRAFQDAVVIRVGRNDVKRGVRLNIVREAQNQLDCFINVFWLPVKLVMEDALDLCEIALEIASCISPARASSITCRGLPPKFKAEM